MNSQRRVPPQVAPPPSPVHCSALKWAGPTVAGIPPSHPAVVDFGIKSNVLNSAACFAKGFFFTSSRQSFRVRMQIKVGRVARKDAHTHSCHPPTSPTSGRPPATSLHTSTFAAAALHHVLHLLLLRRSPLVCCKKKKMLIPSCHHLFLQTVN